MSNIERRVRTEDTNQVFSRDQLLNLTATENRIFLPPSEIGGFIEDTVDGNPLSFDQIFGFINSYTRGDIPDYQASAWLMAVLMRERYGQPLTFEETLNLTIAMAASGEMLDLSGVPEDLVIVDKHSTGGVGDKTTIAISAMVTAHPSIVLAKTSGPALEHTGGTTDKLLSIPGFRIELSEKEFMDQLEDVGIVVAGQSKDLTPADGKLYALRDVTRTVGSLSLIASSIMSKKISSGAEVLILDVKVGKGAFMKTVEDATELAKLMVRIGKAVGMKVIAEITDMDQPLGLAVGNSLEVMEAIETLEGNGPEDFTQHCINTTAALFELSGIAEDFDQAIEMAKAIVKDGSALKKFQEWLEAQGVEANIAQQLVNDPSSILDIANACPVYALEDEYIESVNALEVGLAAMGLGAGREKKGDPIDRAVGIVLGENTKVGKRIKAGEPLFWIFSNDSDKVKEATISMMKAILTRKQPIQEPQFVHAIVK